MHVIILAAGYGTRLTKDLLSDTTGNFHHLRDVPKPLLPIQDKPLLSHWVNLLHKNAQISIIKVIINDLYREKYEQWRVGLGVVGSKVKLIEDGSNSNETRAGAVACIALGISDVNCDTLLIAGDTLFYEDFNLNKIIHKFYEYKKEKQKSCLIMSAPVAEEAVSKHGIIEVNNLCLVTKFLEKPLKSETNSRLQSPCFYLISEHSLKYVNSYLEEMKEEPLVKKDATGNFIRYLIKQVPVHAFSLKGRFDVGGLESYVYTNDNFNGFS